MQPRPLSECVRRGFTLLEMLVVVALLGLALALLVPTPARPVTSREVALELAQALRQTRAQALRNGRPTEFRLDLAARRYWSTAQPQPRFVPATLSMHSETAATTSGAASEEVVVRFAADGSSSGGRFRLRAETNPTRTAELRIHWFDGLVTVNDTTPPP